MYEFLIRGFKGDFVNVLRFTAFTSELEKHPKFNQLYDVLEKIWGYVRCYYKPWEKKFCDYLWSLENGNLMTWLHAVYGNCEKFPVKRRVLKKRKTYNLLNDKKDVIGVLVTLMPFMFYFELPIADDNIFNRYLDRKYRDPAVKAIFIEISFFTSHTVFVKEFNPFVFSHYSFFFSFFKEMLKLGLENVDRVEVRLKNACKHGLNPDFSLTFDRESRECFYRVLEN